MEVKLTNSIQIDCSTEEWWDLELQIRPYIIVENNAYLQKMNLGFSVQNELKEFSLLDLEKTSNHVKATLPIGLWDFIKHFFNKNDVKTLRRQDYLPFDIANKFDYIWNNDEYRYQKKAVLNMLPHFNGILKAAAGSGKTIMGLGLGLLKGKSFLWINDRIELCKQARKTAIELFHVPEEMCGLLQGDNEDIKPYTFTTIQKLNKVLNEGFHDQTQKLNHFDSIIIDECHHCIGSYDDYREYFQAINELDYKYTYGLTATEKRVDGNEFLVFAILGPVRYEVEGTTRTMPAITVNKHCHIETNDNIYETFINKFTGKAIPALVDKYLLFHEQYLEFVQPYIDELIQKYKKVLLVSPRVAGAQWISDYLKSKNIDHFLVYGAIKKREQLYTTKVIVATLDLVKEGFDVPDLEAIAVLSRELHKFIKIQIVGRCERYLEGKQQPFVYFLIPHMKRKKQRIEWEDLDLGDI